MLASASHIGARCTALLALLALVLAGCGGGSGHPAKTTSSIGKPAKVTRQQGLLGGAQSAGAAQSYVPRGAIVADSGFRPQINGFGFENYGNDAGPVNLTPVNLEHLFGPQVCAGGSGKSCVLIPSAKYWMDHVNATMAGGHCMGFSVSALRFFSNDLTPSTFGAARTVDLPVQSNVALQSLIAETFAYQDLPAVTDHAIEGTPTQVLAGLIRALKARNEGYTLGIVKPDGSGGHAITPFAVEDRGGGQAAILVYDNNFPGVVRAVDVDTKADTWRYVGGINPSDTNEVYEGDASTKSMLLLPTTPGEQTQPCPFCPAKPHTGPSTHSPVDKLHYIEVALTAPDSAGAHPHLVFVDSKGRRTGFVKDRLVQEIPGVQVVQNYSVRNWNDAPEPTFHVPVDHPSYKVIVDGANVTTDIKAKIQINGAGLVFYVQDIRIAPGQQDALLLSKGNLAISYQSGSKFPGSPTMGVQFPQFDLKNSTAAHIRARLITMVTGAIGYAPGSPLTMAIRPATGTAVLVSDGARALVPSARYVLSVDSSPVGGGAPERSYLTQKLNLDATKGEIARWHYLRPTSAKLAVDILDANGHRVRRELVPAS